MNVRHETSFHMGGGFRARVPAACLLFKRAKKLNSDGPVSFWREHANSKRVLKNES